MTPTNDNMADPSITDAEEARSRRRADAALGTRIIATLVLAICLTLLGIAMRLTPDPRGFGTHHQLGMGACGMLLTTGLPCPTCGMTTAFAHAVRGQFLAAAWAQPGGLVLALFTIALVPYMLGAVILGRWPFVMQLSRIPPYWLFIALLTVLLGGWAAKLVTGLVTHTLPVTPPIKISEHRIDAHRQFGSIPPVMNYGQLDFMNRA